MKKKYISPEVLCQQLHLDNLLNNGSVTVNNNDLDNQIETGGEAGNGQGSDARRNYNTWDDYDEEDEDY